MDRSTGQHKVSVALTGLGDADIPSGTRQLLLVTANPPSPFGATVQALEKSERGWHEALSPFAAVVGRNGFAPLGEKREGDGRTPSGMFPLQFAFGYGASSPTRMPYRQATENDIWVDDANSPDYNRWVKRGQTTAASFEEMRRPDHLYRHGLVVGYNTAPVIRGHGSAIFFHIWRSADKPSAGCVAMEEAALLELLRWLDPAKEPHAVFTSASFQEPLYSSSVH